VRERFEIEKDVEGMMIVDRVQVELLLDIRDLLVAEREVYASFVKTWGSIEKTKAQERATVGASILGNMGKLMKLLRQIRGDK
jgi:hypothetical protein